MCTGFFTNISTPWNNILIQLWVFSLFYCLTSLPVQFIYRYFLIVHEKTLSYFQYFGILAFSTIFALIYTVNDIVVFSYKEESREFLTKQLSEDSFYYSGIPNFVVADIRSLELQIQFGYSYFLVATSYCIIFYANYKIYKKLSAMKNTMSVNTFKLQKQMTYTLLAQAIVPTIVCIIPIGIALTMAVAKANISGIGQIVSLLYSCIPVANPLTTIIVISK
uniref:Seven TM Receptor n=1 Tax=Panagrolaimus davidi TaxID=227884 RepID=A0A914PF95_9BILA